MRILIVVVALIAAGAAKAAPIVANPPLMDFFGECAGAIQNGDYGCRARHTPVWGPDDQACVIDSTPALVVRCDLAGDYGIQAKPLVVIHRPEPKPHVIYYKHVTVSHN